MLNEKALKAYLKKKFRECYADKYQKLGSWRSWLGFSS